MSHLILLLLLPELLLPRSLHRLHFLLVLSDELLIAGIIWGAEANGELNYTLINKMD